MIEMHKSGNFPLERLCTFYDISDFETAISDVQAGKVRDTLTSGTSCLFTDMVADH